ncbi:hypothetical protein [Aminipila sp.]|uniref:hypothetical protein n=1 Tax=Aminipila sp. TaxID=2060095 RepID=UPI0028973C5D|nr:hypothetical protein [Aminipila sp.]
MKKLLNKRIFAVALALVMVFAMASVSFASNNDLNLTTDSSLYTVKVAPGSTVTLYACPANNSYSPTSFDDENTAKAVNWESSNTSIATVNSVGAESHTISGVSNVLCSNAVISVPSTATIGSCSVEASRTNMIGNKASVNFTVIVDSTATANASDVTVMIQDMNYPGGMVDVNHSSQNFATPLDALAAVKATGEINYSLWGSNYVASITVGTETTTATGNYGWNYRVYRFDGAQDYLRLDESAFMSSDAVKLQDGDIVVWKYTTYDDAQNYFTKNLNDLV